MKYEQIVRNIEKNYNIIQNKDQYFTDENEKNDFTNLQQKQIYKLRNMINQIFGSKEYEYLRKEEHKRIIPCMLKHSNIRIYEDKNEELHEDIYNYSQSGLDMKIDRIFMNEDTRKLIDQKKKGE